MKDGIGELGSRKVAREVRVWEEDSGCSLGKGKEGWEKPFQRPFLVREEVMMVWTMVLALEWCPDEGWMAQRSWVCKQPLPSRPRIQSWQLKMAMHIHYLPPTLWGPTFSFPLCSWGKQLKANKMRLDSEAWVSVPKFRSFNLHCITLSGGVIERFVELKNISFLTDSLCGLGQVTLWFWK